MNKFSWYNLFIILFILFAITINVYVFQKCDMQSFLLGNGGLYAAISGMCDQ